MPVVDASRWWGRVHNIVSEIGQQRGDRRQVRLHVPGRRLHGAGREPGHRRTHRAGPRGCPRPAHASSHRPDDHHDHRPRPAPTTTTVRRRPVPCPPTTARHHDRSHRRPRPPSRSTISQVPYPLKYTRPGGRGPPGRRQGRRGPGDRGHRGRRWWAPHRRRGAASPTRWRRWPPAGAWLLGWPGQQVAGGDQLRRVRPAARAREPGRRGTLHARAPDRDGAAAARPATVPEPCWWWRLLHS